MCCLLLKMQARLAWTDSKVALRIPARSTRAVTHLIPEVCP